MLERILFLMDQRGVTAKKLTTDLGISNSSVSDWKKGSKPSSDVIVKLANYFHVTTDYILLGTLSNDTLSTDDQAWLELIHCLPEDAQNDFRGAMRLYADLHGVAKETRQEKDQALSGTRAG